MLWSCFSWAGTEVLVNPILVQNLQASIITAEDKDKFHIPAWSGAKQKKKKTKSKGLAPEDDDFGMARSEPRSKSYRKPVERLEDRR